MVELFRLYISYHFQIMMILLLIFYYLHCLSHTPKLELKQFEIIMVVLDILVML